MVSHRWSYKTALSIFCECAISSFRSFPPSENDTSCSFCLPRLFLLVNYLSSTYQQLHRCQHSSEVYQYDYPNSCFACTRLTSPALSFWGYRTEADQRAIVIHSKLINTVHFKTCLACTILSSISTTTASQPYVQYPLMSDICVLWLIIKIRTMDLNLFLASVFESLPHIFCFGVALDGIFCITMPANRAQLLFGVGLGVVSWFTYMVVLLKQSSGRSPSLYQLRFWNRVHVESLFGSRLILPQIWSKSQDRKYTTCRCSQCGHACMKSSEV